MSYRDEVDALMVLAQDYLTQAKQQREDWPFCGSALARAFESSVCALFIAWGEPYKRDRKVQRKFDERLAPLLDDELVNFVQVIWWREGEGCPGVDLDLFLTVCEGVVERFRVLATNPPLPGWQAKSVPPPVRWQDLSEDERSFLHDALVAARNQCSGVRLMLIGSRAAGIGPDSDYDVLFVFADEIPELLYGQVIGAVDDIARHRGIELDAPKATEREWATPPSGSRVFLNRAKACHIEVPGELPLVSLVRCVSKCLIFCVWRISGVSSPAC